MTGWRVVVTLIVVGLLAPTAAIAADPASTPPSADERIRALEQDLLRLRSELEALRRALEPATRTVPPADPALLERVAQIEHAVAGFAEEIRRLREDVEVGAESVEAAAVAEARRSMVSVYGHVAARSFEGSASVIDAEAFELVLSGQPHDRLGFFAEVEFERAAAVGGERKGEVVLEQAYSNFNLFPWLNFRAGVILVPFGNVNVDHFAPRRDVISKPLVAYAVAPSDWTDNGVGFYGRTPIGPRLSFSYEAYVIAGLGSDLTSVGMREARQPFGEDNNSDKALAGRGALRASERFELGLSAYRGAWDADSRHDLIGWAIDGRFELGPVTLTGEYDRFTADALGGMRDGRYEGWYARLIWPFGNEFLRATWLGKSFPEATMALVYQRDVVRLAGPEDDGWARNDERRHTWGFNFRPSDHWVLKLDYETSRASRRPIDRGTTQGWIGSVGFVF